MEGARTARYTAGMRNIIIGDERKKISWQGEVVSVQPRSTVWRYLTDHRTHRECGYNIFLKGEVCGDDPDNGSDKYDFCVAVSGKQADKY